MNPVPERAASKAQRNHDIDALRGLSIFVVIFLHYALVLPAKFISIPPSIVEIVARNGFYGVTIFFVISGFLITSSSIKRFGSLDRMEPQRFYRDRFARIYPLLFALVSILTIFQIVGVPNFGAGAGLSVWVASWKALTFQFNWYYAEGASGGMPAWAPLWSLALEEMFYVVFPVICLGLRRRYFIAVALVVIIAQAPLVRTNFQSLYFWSGSADAIALGCLTALLADRIKSLITPVSSLTLRWIGLALIVWRYTQFPVHEDFTFGPTIIAAGASIYLLGSSSIRSPSTLRLFPPLEFIGRRSYEIYLIHTPILLIIKQFVPMPYAGYYDLLFVLYLAIAAGLGEMIGIYFTDWVNTRLRGSTGDPAVQADPLLETLQPDTLSAATK